MNVIYQRRDLRSFVNTMESIFLDAYVAAKIYEASTRFFADLDVNNRRMDATRILAIEVFFMSFSLANFLGRLECGCLCGDFQVTAFARAGSNARFKASIIAGINGGVGTIMMTNVSNGIDGTSDFSILGNGGQASQSFFTQIRIIAIDTLYRASSAYYAYVCPDVHYHIVETNEAEIKELHGATNIGANSVQRMIVMRVNRVANTTGATTLRSNRIQDGADDHAKFDCNFDAMLNRTVQSVQTMNQDSKAMNFMSNSIVLLHLCLVADVYGHVRVSVIRRLAQSIQYQDHRCYHQSRQSSRRRHRRGKRRSQARFNSLNRGFRSFLGFSVGETPALSRQNFSSG